VDELRHNFSYRLCLSVSLVCVWGIEVAYYDGVPIDLQRLEHLSFIVWRVVDHVDGGFLFAQPYV
jgi:hypothetical protein